MSSTKDGQSPPSRRNDFVIECPKCGHQNCIQVLVTCSIPIVIDEHHPSEAAWLWDEAEPSGEVTQYECWMCYEQWQPNEMIADDFVR